MKSKLLILTIALVFQGQFFLLNGTENVTADIITPLEHAYYEQAQHLLEKGLIDLAIPGLKKIVEFHPDSIEIHAYLGWAYSHKGMIADAVEEFQKVLKMHPALQNGVFDYPMTISIPGRVGEFTIRFEDTIQLIDEFSGAHEVLGLCYVLQGRLGNALAEYKKVLQQEPAYYYQTTKVHGKETISYADHAVREYEEILGEDPGCIEAHIKLACAYAEKGLLDLSISHTKKAIFMNPERIEWRVYLACFYAKKWMLDEALKELDETKKAQDHIFEKLLNEGKYCIQNNELDKAISFSRDALNIHPERQQARWMLAEAYSKSGSSDKALKLCRETLTLYPDDLYTSALLGWIYVQCDLSSEAIHVAEQAINKAPENTEILALMAMILASQNQVREALALCTTIVNKTVENVHVTKDFGWVKGTVPSIEQKFREVLDVLEIKPDYTEGYICLGWLYSKNGEMEKAVNAYKKAIELAPDSADAHRYLGNTYIQEGKIRDALQEYAKVFEILSIKAGDDLARGLMYLKNGNTEQAIECFKSVLMFDPGCKDACLSLADAYEKRGQYSMSAPLMLQAGRMKQEISDVVKPQTK
jgi:tetratricopeptide (TPR) repeat protein